MSNFKQLTAAYIDVEKSDYLEEWYQVLIDEKEEPINNSNQKTENVAVNNTKQTTLEDVIKKAA
jgi:hypothetical protein